MQVNMLEAKSQLSKLVKAALDGEEVIIASNGVPMVKLVKVQAARKRRKPGAWAGLPRAASDWDSPEFNQTLAEELGGNKPL
jgi:prevent-host-death family protein